MEDTGSDVSNNEDEHSLPLDLTKSEPETENTVENEKQAMLEEQNEGLENASNKEDIEPSEDMAEVSNIPKNAMNIQTENTKKRRSTRK